MSEFEKRHTRYRKSNCDMESTVKLSEESEEVQYESGEIVPSTSKVEVDLRRSATSMKRINICVTVGTELLELAASMLTSIVRLRTLSARPLRSCSQRLFSSSLTRAEEEVKLGSVCHLPSAPRPSPPSPPPHGCLSHNFS